MEAGPADGLEARVAGAVTDTPRPLWAPQGTCSSSVEASSLGPVLKSLSRLSQGTALLSVLLSPVDPSLGCQCPALLPRLTVPGTGRSREASPQGTP